jgi:hypothetical protein
MECRCCLLPHGACSSHNHSRPPLHADQALRTGGHQHVAKPCAPLLFWAQRQQRLPNQSNRVHQALLAVSRDCFERVAAMP